MERKKIRIEGIFNKMIGLYGFWIIFTKGDKEDIDHTVSFLFFDKTEYGKRLSLLPTLIFDYGISRRLSLHWLRRDIFSISYNKYNHCGE